MSRRDDEELLAAYVDGVSELTPDERKRAEAVMTPGDAEATRALLGQLRTLSPEGDEPDWHAMERSISRAVGQKLPRPWWSISWRWALPVIACAAAVIAVVIATRPDVEPAPVAHVVSPTRPTRPTKPVDAAPGPADEQAPMVYLDGEALDIGTVDPTVLDEVEAPDVADEENLIPNDHWVDQLDDRALDRAERMLAKRKKS